MRRQKEGAGRVEKESIMLYNSKGTKKRKF